MYELTIIVPIYNSVKYLKRCLDSIPDRDDVEVIAVDDGSTDGSQKVLKEYTGRVKTIYHRSNRGVSAARNEGLTYALGKWVTFLDSDDEYLPGAVDKMIESLCGCKEPVIQFNHMRNGQVRPNQYAQAREWTLDRLPPKWVLVWNKAYNRKFLKDNRIYFPLGQQLEEDRYFNFKCFEHSPKLVTKDIVTVNKHIENPNSLCRTVNGDKLVTTALSNLTLLKKVEDEKLKGLIWRCTAELMECKEAQKAFGGER